MKILQFLTDIFEKKEQTKNLQKIESKYAPLKIVADEAKFLVSAMQKEPIFFDDEAFYRLLSIQEVLDADVDMNVAFKEKGILPCIDCGDNDFISYDFTKHAWCKFNIMEEFEYASRNSILEYFKDN